MNNSKLMLSLADLKEQDTINLVKQELEAGQEPLKILKALREGMILVSERFEKGEFYLPEMIMAGEIFKDASDILRKSLPQAKMETKGQVVFGTVQGDIHDIGKDIVVALLQGVGYEVHDLGVDISPDKFVKKLQETGAAILCLSGLITPSFNSMKDTVKALTDAGLREKVKVIVGGAVMNEKVLSFTGADAFGKDPIDAIKLCQQFEGGN